MSRSHKINGGWWVVAKDGYHILYSPSGEELKYVIVTTVTDRVNEIGKCIAEFVVNVGTMDEMREATDNQ